MPQSTLTIKELTELSGIAYDAIESAYRRDKIHGKMKDGILVLSIDSFLKEYPDCRETFLKNWRDMRGNRYRETTAMERTYRSTIDPNKVMTAKAIHKEVLEQFVLAVSVEDKIALCKVWQSEFPEVRGISYKTMYRMHAEQRMHGKSAGERKVRADQGKDRTSLYDWCYKDFEDLFLKYFMSHTGDDINRYAGGNVMKSYRLAIMELCRKHGYALQDLKDCYAMRKEAEAHFAKEWPGENRKLPTEAAAYSIAQRPVLLAARKFRLHKNRHYMETLPIHKFDYWRQLQFMESVHSDWHKMHENYKVVLSDGKEKEKSYHVIFWVEAKTGFIMHWSRQAVGSPNGDRTILSCMDVVKKYGRPDSFRFDNGMEFINSRNWNTIMDLYSISECDERQRIERAQSHKGWQKIVERVNEQIENIMKLSDGYAGSNREVAAHPALGTAPIKAFRTLSEMDQIVGDAVKIYNHEWIEVNMKYADGMRDLDLIFEGSEGPKLSRQKGRIRARRIDLFNAFRKRYTALTYTDDYLVMVFGLPEEQTVRNSGVWKTWWGEKFLYIPKHNEATILSDYDNQQVIIKYDPASEYSLQKLFVFERTKNGQRGKYITTVYCDLLNGYTREQAEDYRKAKLKINKFLKTFNEQFVVADALKKAMEMQLERETPITEKTAGKVIVWSNDVQRFSENRDKESEALHEMMDIRREMESEAQASPWVFDEDEQNYVNQQTGEISYIRPDLN